MIVEVVPVPTTVAGGAPVGEGPGAPGTTLPLVQQVSTQQVQQAIADRQTNVQDLSLPVYVNSALPNPEPENPLVIQTSSESRLDIITINDQVVQLQDAEGFRLSVSATDETGELTRVSASGAIIVEQQSFITVSGEGFKPNSDAVAWLFSEPRRLGVVRVGSDGKFQESLQIGSDVAVGRHTTQVNGLTVDGEVRSLNLAVEVVSPKLADDKALVTDTTVDPVITSDGATGEGTSYTVGVLVIGVLVGAGAMWFVLVRRRRHDEDNHVR